MVRKRGTDRRKGKGSFVGKKVIKRLQESGSAACCVCDVCLMQQEERRCLRLRLPFATGSHLILFSSLTRRLLLLVRREEKPIHHTTPGLRSHHQRSVLLSPIRLIVPDTSCSSSGSSLSSATRGLVSVVSGLSLTAASSLCFCR